jgi:hypothetical protein
MNRTEAQEGEAHKRQMFELGAGRLMATLGHRVRVAAESEEDESEASDQPAIR